MHDRSMEMGIGKRVVISSIFGVSFAAIFFLPLAVDLPESYVNETDFWLRMSVLLDLMLRGLIGIPFFLILVSPLIVIALIVARIFEASIDRYTGAWCIAAPLSVWLFVCVFIWLRSESAFLPPDSDLKQLLSVMNNKVNLLFLLGPIPSAVLFYNLTPPPSPVTNGPR